MRRRTLLRAGAASLALPTVGTAAGRPPTTAAYAPTAHVDVDGAAEVVVADGTAFVAATTGFATVDVSDPTEPTLLAERRALAADNPAGPLEGILDVKVDGDRLLVAGPAQGGNLRGFFLYDVSDPADPQQVGEFFDTTHSVHNAVLHDGYAWLQAGAEVHVVDVREAPFESVARWSPLDADPDWADVPATVRTLHDLWVQGDRAYLAHWDAGVFVLDAADPANPSYLGRFGDYTLAELREWDDERAQRDYLTPAGNAHYVATDESGDVAGVGAEAWEQDGEGGPGGIDLYDVSDPENAEHLSTIHAPGAPNGSYYGGTWTTAHNFDFAGDRLYTAWYQGGVMIHDVSDPTAPERLAWWRDTRDAFWTAQVVTQGSHFVATTIGRIAETSRLYVFPDEAGQQADPPDEISEPEPPSSGAESTRMDPATTAPGTTAGATTAADDGADGATSVPGGTTADGDAGDGDGGGSPGLGVASALAGLGVAAWRLRRRSGED